jgi:hypothetical protein
MEFTNQSASAIDRAAVNRANAQYSTGPKTDEGKQRSSQNSFKHGVYSRSLILPTENPQEFKELREALFAEHNPATATENVLVDELVHNAWRIRRYRRLEISALDAPHCEGGHNFKLMAVVERALASSERGFHRALTALHKLQKERGFVPQNQTAVHDDTSAKPNRETEPRSLSDVESPANGFVSANTQALDRGSVRTAGFVPQISSTTAAETGIPAPPVTKCAA